MNLNIAEFNDELINVNKITKISYDEVIDKYVISIQGEPNPVKISKEQYEDFKVHLKNISNSYFTG